MKLHHVGIAVQNIARQGAAFCETLGCAPPQAAIDDATQNVRVAFSDLGEGVAVEFVEPLGKGSPVDAIVGRGGGLYHLCFEVEDLEASIARVRARGGLLLNGPVPASAFDGRRIAFVYTSARDLIEFVEADSA